MPAGTNKGKQIPGIGEWIMHNAKIPVTLHLVHLARSLSDMIVGNLVDDPIDRPNLALHVLFQFSKFGWSERRLRYWSRRQTA